MTALSLRMLEVMGYLSDLHEQHPTETVGFLSPNSEFGGTCRKTLAPKGLVSITRISGKNVRYSLTGKGIGALEASSGNYALDRLLAKCALNEKSGCWDWTGAHCDNGYGNFLLGKRVIPAHRASYILHVGPILEGLVIDHLCKNVKCVNPKHLEPVTQQVNVIRGRGPAATKAIAAARTHCGKGHPYSENETFISGKRCCAQCGRERALAAYYRNHEINKAKGREAKRKLGRREGLEISAAAAADIEP